MEDARFLDRVLECEAIETRERTHRHFLVFGRKILGCHWQLLLRLPAATGNCFLLLLLLR